MSEHLDFDFFLAFGHSFLHSFNDGVQLVIDLVIRHKFQH